jgi:di/tricarboxylate transporter
LVQPNPYFLLHHVSLIFVLAQIRLSCFQKMNTARILIGPLLFVISLIIANFSSIPFAMCAVAGTVAWMIYWWVTETVSMSVTALLPMVVFPLTGVLTLKK